MLDDIADELPVELYRELNGGIVLDRGYRMHPCAVNNDLYILGVYIRDNLGKRIVIYYGSFIRVFKNKTREQIADEVEEELDRIDYLCDLAIAENYDVKRICDKLTAQKK